MLVSTLSNRPCFHSHLRLPRARIGLSLTVGVFSVDAAMVPSPPYSGQGPMRASSSACRRGLSTSLASFAPAAAPGFAGSGSGTGPLHPADCRIPSQASNASTASASSARCSCGGRRTFAAFAPVARSEDGPANADCRWVDAA